MPWKRNPKCSYGSLNLLTCANGVDRDTRVPWPESACRSDLSKFVGAFDLGLGQPYPRPDDIMGFPDCLDIGFERPGPITCSYR